MGTTDALTLYSGSSYPFGALGLAISISLRLASIAILNSSSSSSAVCFVLASGGSLPMNDGPLSLFSAKDSSIAL